MCRKNCGIDSEQHAVMLDQRKKMYDLADYHLPGRVKASAGLVSVALAELRSYRDFQSVIGREYDGTATTRNPPKMICTANATTEEKENDQNERVGTSGVSIRKCQLLLLYVRRKRTVLRGRGVSRIFARDNRGMGSSEWKDANFHHVRGAQPEVLEQRVKHPERVNCRVDIGRRKICADVPAMQAYLTGQKMNDKGTTGNNRQACLSSPHASPSEAQASSRRQGAARAGTQGKPEELENKVKITYTMAVSSETSHGKCPLIHRSKRTILKRLPSDSSRNTSPAKIRHSAW